MRFFPQVIRATKPLERVMSDEEIEQAWEKLEEQVRDHVHAALQQAYKRQIDKKAIDLREEKNEEKK